MCATDKELDEDICMDWYPLDMLPCITLYVNWGCLRMPTKGGAAGGKGDMGYCQLGEIRGLNRGDIGGRLMESWGGLLSIGIGGGIAGIW